MRNIFFWPKNRFFLSQLDVQKVKADNGALGDDGRTPGLSHGEDELLKDASAAVQMFKRQRSVENDRLNDKLQAKLEAKRRRDEAQKYVSGTINPSGPFFL